MTDCTVTDFLQTISAMIFMLESKKHPFGHEHKRIPKMSHAEFITIMTLFRYGSFRNMKHFYIELFTSAFSTLINFSISMSSWTEGARLPSACRPSRRRGRRRCRRVWDRGCV